jgi:two-component system, cell cycle sensor histidine kinase and response regulator CckA
VATGGIARAFASLTRGRAGAIRVRGEATRHGTQRDNGLAVVLAGTVAALAVVALDLLDGDLSMPVAALGAFAVGTVVARLVTSRGQQRLVAELERTVARQEQAELELERSVSMLRSTLESTADGIVALDRDRRIVDWNERFREMWGVPEELLRADDAEQVLGIILRQIDDSKAGATRFTRLIEDPDAEEFQHLACRDGRLIERFTMPHFVGGESVGRVWSFRDVTDRSRLQNELRQAQKLEAVGRLAGGIAHEFNNLLTAILGHADLLLGEVESTSSRESAVEIRRASERAAALTSQLLAYGRKQILRSDVVDLNEVVGNMGGLLSPLLGETIELAIVKAREPARVLVDTGQIEQVVMNLVINARDAMPNGGRIEIAPGRAADGRVVLTVRDNGCGMDERTMQQAFEPFFTTKPQGEGTGLGLPTVLGIVEQSGGHVSLESTLGSGTTVEVLLPPASTVAETADPPPESTPVKHESRGTILLVEDETVVRELLTSVLVKEGHEVLVAADGEEALALATSHDGPLDVLLTDLVMPGISGRALAERLTDARPELAVVYMSGYTEDAIVRHGVREAGAMFLQKPFKLPEVIGTVGELLANRSRRAA